MNRTNNYNLCQWEETDRVRRTDFNEDNAKIDAALGGMVRRVAELEKSRFYTGSYVGNGASSRTISLPWAPSFMILLTWVHGQAAIVFLYPGRSAYVRTDVTNNDASAYLRLQGSSLVILHDWMNRSGETSSYILFR